MPRRRPQGTRRFVTLFLILFAASTAGAQIPEHGLTGNDALLIPLSVSDDDGLLALYHNPAALALRPGEYGLLYLQGLRAGTNEAVLKPAFEQRFTGDWSAALGGKIAFGLDHVSLPAGYIYGPGEDERETVFRRSNRHNFAASHRFDLQGWRAQLALGAAYRWTRSQAYALDGLGTWDLGAILRWRRWASCGLLVRNLDRPRLRGLEPGDWREIIPSYTFGLSLRPKRHWATFSFDVTQYEVDSGWEYESHAGFDLNMAGRLRLRLDWRDDSRFRLGVFLSEGFLRSGLAMGNQHAGEKGTRYGSLGIEWRNRRHGGPILPGRHFLDLALSGGYTDAPARRRLGEGSPGHTLALLELIDKARRERDVKGILLRLDQPGLGFAQREELRRALLQFRRVTGRPVVVYADSFDAEDYYLATAGSRILLNPAGALRFTGLRSDRFHPEETLTGLGVEVELLGRGRFQGAQERSGESSGADAREADSSFAAARFMALSRGIAEGRNIPLTEIPALIDRGGLRPVLAQEIGLVDALVNPDELREWLAREEDQGRLIEPGRLVARRYSKDHWGEDPALAVIHIDGTLVTGRGGQGLLGREVGAATVVEAIREARRDQRVRGVLLRVNSGGGSMLASEILSREIVYTRKWKPVVVSMGEAGAGGAYLLSVEADKLLCSNGTLTGGIGVWGGRFSTSGLLDKLGIGREDLARAGFERRADPLTPDDAETRAQLQEELDRHYAHFIEAVSARRYISRPEVELIARGRIWSGLDAIQHGLIDELGGFAEALSALRRLTRIPPGSAVDLIQLPAPPSLMTRMRQRHHGAGAEATGLLPMPGETLPAWLTRLEPFPGETVLALEPAALTLLPAASLR